MGGLQAEVEYEFPAPMSRRDLLAARQRFRELEEKSRTATQVIASRSNLEAYIFRSREALSSEEVAKLHSEDRITELGALLTAAESWLEEKGESATAQQLLAKLNSLKREMDPILDEPIAARMKEDAEKPGKAGSESPKERAARIARKNDAKRQRDMEKGRQGQEL